MSSRELTKALLNCPVPSARFPVSFTQQLERFTFALSLGNYALLWEKHCMILCTIFVREQWPLPSVKRFSYLCKTPEPLFHPYALRGTKSWNTIIDTFTVQYSYTGLWSYYVHGNHNNCMTKQFQPIFFKKNLSHFLAEMNYTIVIYGSSANAFLSLLAPCCIILPILAESTITYTTDLMFFQP